MKLSELINQKKIELLFDHDYSNYELLNELYSLALKWEDAEREVQIKPLKELQKIANKFFREGNKDKHGHRIKYPSTVYICTNGKPPIRQYERNEYKGTFICNKNYIPKKDEAVFKFSTKTKVIITPHRWSNDKHIIIEKT